MVMPKKEKTQKAKPTSITLYREDQDRIKIRMGIKSSGVSISSQISNDLNMYWSLCKYGMKSIYNILSQDEIKLILDIMNGCYWDGPGISLWITGGLSHNIEDSFVEGYDKKWNVDGPELLKKINKLSPLEIVALLDFCRVWWNNCENEERTVGMLSRFTDGGGDER